MQWAQRTSFKTLDNWGHKTPTQSKKSKDKKEKIKGSWPRTHTIYLVTYFLYYIYHVILCTQMREHVCENTACWFLFHYMIMNHDL